MLNLAWVQYCLCERNRFGVIVLHVLYNAVKEFFIRPLDISAYGLVFISLNKSEKFFLIF